MEKLIDFESYPIKIALKVLLQDKTTKKNIIWATVGLFKMVMRIFHEKERGTL